MLYDDGLVFNGISGQFLPQYNGHNCGPIAFLNCMEIYDSISIDIIKKNHGKNGSSYHELVYEQHHMCLGYLKDELVVNEWVKKDVIVKERDLLCVCKAFISHNLTASHVMPCCSAKFHTTCITDFINKYMWCPYCGTETKSNDILLLRGLNDVQEIGKDIFPEQSEEKAKDALHKLSVQKKCKFQEN